MALGFGVVVLRLSGGRTERLKDWYDSRTLEIDIDIDVHTGLLIQAGRGMTF